MNLPNRDELLFRVVLALPKASRIGLAFKILDSKAPPAEVPKLSHKYFKMYLVDSVFPAPLSPEIKKKILIEFFSPKYDVGKAKNCI